MSDEVTESRFRSRKFLITTAALVIASVALWVGKVDGVQWASVAVACVGAYNLANAFSSRS